MITLKWINTPEISEVKALPFQPHALTSGQASASNVELLTLNYSEFTVCFQDCKLKNEM